MPTDPPTLTVGQALDGFRSILDSLESKKKKIQVLKAVGSTFNLCGLSQWHNVPFSATRVGRKDASPKRSSVRADPGVKSIQKQESKRPKSNTPRGEKSTGIGTKRAEPLDVADAALEPRRSVQYQECAGSIELNIDLPATIAIPVVFLITKTPITGYVPDKLTHDMSQNIISMSYYKCAKQLYSSLTSIQKTALQPFEPILKDDTAVPIELVAAVSVIGHFESEFGLIQVKNPIVLCKRWILLGNRRITIAEPKPIFNDDDSKDYLNSKLDEYLEDPQNISFTITVQQSVSEVSLRKFDYGKSLSYNLSLISNLHPNSHQLRGCLRLRMASYSVYHAMFRENPAEFSETLRLLKLQRSEIDHKLAVDLFAEHRLKWSRDIEPVLSSITIMRPSPGSGKGRPAQLVSSKDTIAKYSLPLTDSDLRLGWILNPCSNFKFTPSFSASAKLKREDRLHQFMNSSISNIIHCPV